MENDLDNNRPSVLLSLLNQISALTTSQRRSVETFDSSTYANEKEGAYTQEVLQLYTQSLNDMKIGSHPDIEVDWKLTINFKSKSVIEAESLFANLRLLPDEDVRRIRLFNRFVGQQIFRTTTSEFFEYEERHDRNTKNPFFNKLTEQVAEFAGLNEVTIEPMTWPEQVMDSEQRRDFIRKIDEWRAKFVTLPGVRVCAQFFTPEKEDIYNTFFHTQRQFDSDTWKDFDEKGQPYAHPIPRITSYRDKLKEMSLEFEDAEGSVSMCYDYCRMKVDKVIPFIRQAEDAFLKIVNHLDDDYPLGLDFAHYKLHSEANEIKHMMFPLRCLFFEELENLRGVKDSNDNTLDSYLDLTLGKDNTYLPEAYKHYFDVEDLDVEIKEVISDILGGDFYKEGVFDKDRAKISALGLIIESQTKSQEECDLYGEKLKDISKDYEEKYKNDEENISRRLARILYLYVAALSKKEIMRKASQDRLDNIQVIANRYSARADNFADVDIEDDKCIRELKDEDLPLMASPEQMEDIYNTQKVVQRLSENNEEFEQTAKDIEKGLRSAMDMMRKAEEFMARMINRMFVNKDDSRDLLDSVHELVALSYTTQQNLADLAKKEMMNPKYVTKKVEAEIEELKQSIENNKSETVVIQGKLRDILAAKRELITKMRITQDEKDTYKHQLRMITVMTINSMQAQNMMPEETA